MSVALSDKALAFSLYSIAVDSPAVLTLSVIFTSKELEPVVEVLTPVTIPLMYPLNTEVEPEDAMLC